MVRRRRSRSGSVLLAVGAVVGALLAGTPVMSAGAAPRPADAPPASAVVTRLAGADRFGTSAAVSAATYTPGVAVAYVASGLNYPDALTGAPVAGRDGGPLLLVRPDSVPTVIATELGRLRPARIVVLGGPSVVSNTVKAALGSFTSGSVTRLAGVDRFGTSAAVSRASYAPGVTVAYVASGLNYPDALTAAPVAGRDKGPLLLVRPDVIPTVIATELGRLHPARIVVLGGPSVVSAAVTTRLASYTSGSVTRLAGADRFATSAAVSAASYAPGVAVVYVASGLNFPDALSSATVAGRDAAPLLLVRPDTIPAEISTELGRLEPARIVVLGGSSAVSNTVKARLATYGAPIFWVQITAGGSHTCGLDTVGQAYCWGFGSVGQLGNGAWSMSAVPVAVDTSGVLAGKRLTEISAGGGHTCAIDSTGKGYCWGAGSSGQLGNGSSANSAVPVAVDTASVLSGKTLTHISAGQVHTCAVDTAGRAHCWGMGGLLGDGSMDSSSVPVAVTTSGGLAGKTLTQMSVGWFHTCALDSAGRSYCWGGNVDGELGDGSTSQETGPVAVDMSGALAGKTLTQIAGGEQHTCAVDIAGRAYCWGDNRYLQLGTTSVGWHTTVPLAVPASGPLAGKTLTQLTAGRHHVCALDSAGASYCWGHGEWGQLGVASTPFTSLPVAVNTSGVLAGKILTQISAGTAHTCACDNAGKAYCWGQFGIGLDGIGLLGNGSTTGSTAPVTVVDP